MPENISLRVMEKTDIDLVHRLYNDPAIMDFWFAEAHMSKIVIEGQFDKYDENPQTRNFILHNNAEGVGLVQLTDIDYIHRKAEFGIMIDPTEQGKGYALIATHLAISYAFRTLNLHKLYLIADEENKKAIHIYEKAGFQQEAVLQEEFFVNGKYRNIVYMSMFQTTYLQQIDQ